MRGTPSAMQAVTAVLAARKSTASEATKSRRMLFLCVRRRLCIGRASFMLALDSIDARGGGRTLDMRNKNETLPCNHLISLS